MFVLPVCKVVLGQHLGFFHFLYLKDAHTAAAVLEDAAKLPGAAFWLKTLAAELLSKGGDRAASREMWQRMYDQAEEGILRKNAKLQLAVLDSLDRADRLAAVVREFERLHGRRPRLLEELRIDGLWREPLGDLSGTPFRYDESSGQVSVARESTLWRPS